MARPSPVVIKDFGSEPPPDHTQNMSESFAELFEQSQVEQKMRPGTIVVGTVMEIRGDFVVVNAGLKSEGVIPCDQFRLPDGTLEVAVGDEVDVALDAVEDGYGETRLSREKAKRARAWDELGRHQFDSRVSAGLPRRCPPGSRYELSRRQATRIQGHQGRPAS